MFHEELDLEPKMSGVALSEDLVFTRPGSSFPGMNC
jgi:hypothetical protein